MADFDSFPQENQYETQIVGEISSGATAPFNIEVKKAPGFTLSSGTIYAVLEPGTSKEEGVEINAISGTTLTVSTRGLPTAKGGSATTTTHGGGAKIIFTDNWQTFDDIATAIASKPDLSSNNTWTGDQTFSGTVDIDGETTISENLKFDDTGTAGVNLNQLTTAQRTALSPDDGAMVYDTDDNLVYQYLNGAWASVDTGTTYTGGDGISITAGDIDVDLTDTTTFKEERTGNEKRAVATKAVDGKIDETFLQTTDANVTTLVGGGSASALHNHTKTAIQGTRAINAATGSVSYAHGLSVTPTAIQIVARYNRPSSTAPSIMSDGFSNDTVDVCTYVYADASGYNLSANDASYCVDIYAIDGDSDSRRQQATASFDGTNVDLSWVYTEVDTGAATGNISFTIIVYA